MLWIMVVECFFIVSDMDNDFEMLLKCVLRDEKVMLRGSLF